MLHYEICSVFNIGLDFDLRQKHSTEQHNNCVFITPFRVPGMGELITASVSSREDHGYIMDIGSNTIRGFVPAKTMSKVNNISAML